MNKSWNSYIVVSESLSSLNFYKCFYIYVSQIFTKVHSCKLKTYVMAGFLKDCTKVQKIHVSSWGTPSSPWSGGCRPSSMGRATILIVVPPQRSCTHKGPYSGPRSINKRRVSPEYSSGVILSGAHCIELRPTKVVPRSCCRMREAQLAVWRF